MKKMKIFAISVVVLFLFVSSFVATTIAKYVKEESSASFKLSVRVEGKIDLAITDGKTETMWENHNIPIIPGTSAEFAPYVRVGAGSEPAYLFIEVTKEGSTEEHTFDSLIELNANSGWRILETNESGDTVVYYWEGDVAKANEAQYFPITELDNVFFSEEITEEVLTDIAGKAPKITISAYAVQKTKLDEGDPAIEGAKSENPAAAWEYLQ